VKKSINGKGRVNFPGPFVDAAFQVLYICETRSLQKFAGLSASVAASAHHNNFSLFRSQFWQPPFKIINRNGNTFDLQIGQM
jgi:hypothetical protein